MRSLNPLITRPRTVRLAVPKTAENPCRTPAMPLISMSGTALMAPVALVLGLDPGCV